MSRSVSIDAMNKISYCLTYHSFLFCISKLLFVTVILYFCIHFHLAPVEGLFFKPKYRANILCICFNFIAVLFLFLSSPWGSVYRFLHSICLEKLHELHKIEQHKNFQHNRFARKTILGQLNSNFFHLIMPVWSLKDNWLIDSLDCMHEAPQIASFQSYLDMTVSSGIPCATKNVTWPAKKRTRRHGNKNGVIVVRRWHSWWKCCFLSLTCMLW